MRRRLLRILAGSLTLGLVLFHLRLLWLRVSDQSVLEPVILAKWVITAVLLAALWRLRTSGFRLLTDKRAGVIWLLALLLHIQAPVIPESALTGPADLGWLFALPATVSFGAAVAITLGLALAALLSAEVRPPDGALRRSTRRLGGPLARSLPALSCRPPPPVS